MTQHDDEPRETPSYVPFMPSAPYRPPRSQRRARAQLRGRAQRRRQRRATALVKELGLDQPWKRPQLADDEGPGSQD
ncbi:hypothetical protein HOT45_gp66 [Gordonia phage Trine]|uniref:Uncharacterized protein n=1 Tax=Gordonia phage Trine TaxID=2201431 RepID=A0A2Z4Q913_9CAUD|nr:hypothetical protein HOT45_gp66 [Gordonia phage Trine]AWY06567.1 hypothetical protein PBI_TRINE_66 [Gordonia phage Trine]